MAKATAPPGRAQRHLVVGLGNPGDSYRHTRHNIGFMVAAAFADTHSIALDHRKFDVQFGSGRIEGRPVMVALPQAYMNRSGPGTRRLADYFDISCAHMLVVHDDIDLEFGRLKIKMKGGSGGHNGLRSLMDAFGCGDFGRLRIGIGRCDDRREVTDHVLGKFTPDERQRLAPVIDQALAAIQMIVCKGKNEAMNHFNVRNTLIQI